MTKRQPILKTVYRKSGKIVVLLRGRKVFEANGSWAEDSVKSFKSGWYGEMDAVEAALRDDARAYVAAEIKAERRQMGC